MKRLQQKRKASRKLKYQKRVQKEWARETKKAVRFSKLKSGGT